MNDQICLRAEHITKVFPGTTALHDVMFNVYEGKVNILVGENGAGKSTLMKIIAGAEQPTTGTLLLAGDPIDIRTPLEAQRLGIGMIYQEINLCENMSVSDNIFLSQEMSAWGTIDFRRQREVVKEVLARLQHEIDPDAIVGELGVSAQQIVAIAKALRQNVKILIMDEPTSALTANEVTILFRVIRELRARGVTIIYISHRLEELIQIGDYITVLRDGRVEAESKLADVDINWIIAKMVGRSLRDFLPQADHSINGVALAVNNLSYPRKDRGYFVDHVSFSVRAGEIVGLYGLMGAGRSELFQCLVGTHREASGEITVGGQVLSNKSSVDDRISSGLVLVPEDRQAEGIIQSMSVANNIVLPSVERFARFGLLPRQPGLRSILDAVRRLSIRISSLRQNVTDLSGGNQQKVIIAKALLTTPKVLLMDEPTRGIDVNAKSEIFAIMTDLAKRGIAVLFASSELKEIMTLSDRVLVMARGKLTGEFRRGEYSEADLVNASAKEGR